MRIQHGFFVVVLFCFLFGCHALFADVVSANAMDASVQVPTPEVVAAQTAPLAIIRLTAPVADIATSSGTIAVSGRIENDLSVTTAAVRILDGDQILYEIAIPTGNQEFTVLTDLGTISDGTYRLCVYANQVQAVSVSQNIGLILDRMPPEVLSEAINPGYVFWDEVSKNVIFSVKAQDMEFSTLNIRMQIPKLGIDQTAQFQRAWQYSVPMTAVSGDEDVTAIDVSYEISDGVLNRTEGKQRVWLIRRVSLPPLNLSRSDGPDVFDISVDFSDLAKFDFYQSRYILTLIRKTGEINADSQYEDQDTVWDGEPGTDGVVVSYQLPPDSNRDIYSFRGELWLDGQLRRSAIYPVKLSAN